MRELDEQCARALGYDTVWADGVFGHTLYLVDRGAYRSSPNVTSNCTLLGASWERVRIDGAVTEIFARICPAFSAQHNDARMLLDEIKRKGREYTFTAELRCIVEPQLGLDDWELHWGLIYATPEQIAQAFVKVMHD